MGSRKLEMGKPEIKTIMITVGIAGGSGYVAGEMLRCLLQHPAVKIDFIYSHSQAGTLAAQVHEDLYAYPDLVFSDTINPEVDVLFLCLGHGNSRKFLTKHEFSSSTKVIDLGNDFRLKADAELEGRSFVYGLVELHKDKIKTASNIANPGCFATAIQLAMLPLVRECLIQDEVHVHAITGSTGAGQSLKATSHFSWRNNNLSIYKAFSHQHLGEIGENGGAGKKSLKINFLPVRGDFTRGIFVSLYANCELEEKALQALYQDYYATASFTHLTEKTINLKQVVNTNNCLLQVQKVDGKVLVTSVIDNLLKGAAGQAIHNMNLLFGLEETTGLHFKANYF